MSGAPGPPAQEVGGLDNAFQARKPRGFTCIGCRKAKQRCSGTFPCTRCFKFCLKCELPSRGTVEEKATVASVAFTRFNVRQCAESMTQAYFQLLEEGLVNRDKLLAMMKFWRARSLLYGSDATWGAAAIFAASAKPPISDLELEGMHSVLLDQPSTVTRARLLMEYYNQYAAIEELKGMEFFKAMANDPKKAVFMSVFDSAGKLYESGNAMFENMFMPTVEFLESAAENKTIKTLLCAAMMEPDDRILWFRTLLEVAVTPATRAVHFIKVCDRDGQIGLYIMENRMAMIPGSTGITVGMVSLLEPVPTSRHVHGHRGYRDHLKKFKADENEESVSRAGSSLALGPDMAVAQSLVDGAAAVPHLPAFAAVPMPDSSGSRIATTSDPAEQEAFMQKANAIFKLTALTQTNLHVTKPPIELPPKPSKPRQRRRSATATATATATKGSKIVPTSSSSSSSSSSTPLLQHEASSAITSAEGEEDDYLLEEWEGDELVDELVEEDVIAAAMEEFGGGDEMTPAMQGLVGGDEITAAMQQLQDDDGL